MPYMQYLYCEHCGNYAQLDIDPAATIDAYAKDYAEGTRKSVEFDPTTFMWDYIMYACEICGRYYKYTYQDVEKRVREHLSSRARESKEYLDEFIEESQGRERNEPTPEYKKEVAERRAAITERVRNLYTDKK